MELLKWDDSYSVGVGDLDNQHRGLLQIINKLNEIQEDKFDANQFSEVIASLIHYAYSHFAAEESYMTQANYPDQKQHIIQHVDFIIKVLSLALKAEAGNQSDITDFIQFLKKWYAAHVLGIDRQYIPYLAAKGF